jgi:hypothetical protein
MSTQRALEPLPLRRHFAALKAKIASLPAAGDKGSKRVAELKAKAPRTLPEARERLAELGKLAAERGTQLAPSFVEGPRTLDQARSLIGSLERQLDLVGAAASVIAPPATEIKPVADDLLSKAPAFGRELTLAGCRPDARSCSYGAQRRDHECFRTGASDWSCQQKRKH